MPTFYHLSSSITSNNLCVTVCVKYQSWIQLGTLPIPARCDSKPFECSNSNTALFILKCISFVKSSVLHIICLFVQTKWQRWNYLMYFMVSRTLHAAADFLFCKYTQWILVCHCLVNIFFCTSACWQLHQATGDWGLRDSHNIQEHPVWLMQHLLSGWKKHMHKHEPQ